MTQTTTHVNACDASIWLDNAAGTPTDISGSSNKISIEFTREVGELRTFQVKWPVRTGCGKDATFTLTAVYSTAANEAKDILLDWWFADDPGSRTIHVYIPDKNVGSDHFYGEVTIQDVTWDTDPTEPGPIAVDATLLADGAITYTVAAT